MRRLHITFGMIALTAFTGCQKAPAPPVPTTAKPLVFPTSGRVIVGNVPAGNARICFHPVDAGKSQGRRAVAVTDRDGTFHLTTYMMYDGAPEGDYTVTITWPDEALPEDNCECTNPALHDRLAGKYSDPTRTPLLATVRPRQNEINLVAEADKPQTMAGFGRPAGD